MKKKKQKEKKVEERTLTAEKNPKKLVVPKSFKNFITKK